MDFLKPYASQLLSVLRIMSGLLPLQHGTGKYLNFPVGPMNNVPPRRGCSRPVRLVGGVLIIIGLFTRRSPSSCPAWRWPILGMRRPASFRSEPRRAGGALLLRLPHLAAAGGVRHRPDLRKSLNELSSLFDGNVQRHDPGVRDSKEKYHRRDGTIVAALHPPPPPSPKRDPRRPGTGVELRDLVASLGLVPVEDLLAVDRPRRRR